MFLAGSFLYKVDAKGRINIPSNFRSQIEPAVSLSGEGQMFYVTTDPEGCLNVFPENIFQDIASKMEGEIGSYLSPNPKMKTYVKVMASAKPCRSDQQGRIIVHKDQLEVADIKDQVLIVGLGQRMQLWNPSRYEVYIQSS